MKNYGKNIQDKAQQLIDAHKKNGMDDQQAKNAAIVTLDYMFREAFSYADTFNKSTWQKVYNHLTGTNCPYR